MFDHLSHNHIEPRAEYDFFLDVLLVHSDLSLDEIDVSERLVIEN